MIVPTSKGWLIKIGSCEHTRVEPVGEGVRLMCNALGKPAGMVIEIEIGKPIDEKNLFSAIDRVMNGGESGLKKQVSHWMTVLPDLVSIVGVMRRTYYEVMPPQKRKF